MMESALGSVLRRERAVTWGALAIMTALAWLWVLLGAGTGMSTIAMSTWQFPPPRPVTMMQGDWSPAYWLTMLFMWWVMMIAMMLPSAAPVILLYARVVGQIPGAVTPTMAFAAGYLVCWLGFSVLATALQFALERSGVVDGMMMWSTERWLTVGLLVGAGLYQLSPLKTACLAQCRSPAEFLTRHRRPGRLGAFHMGLVHGAYCLGCCWALMLLLFAAGIMNLVWIAGLSIVVLLEKLAPFGAALTKPLAVLFLIAAAAVAAPALARDLPPPMAVGATRVAAAAAGAPAVTVAAPGTPSPAIKQGGRFQPADRRHGAGVGDFATAAARSSPT